MRILALDWGVSRIGAAVSDESQTIAMALDRPFTPKTVLAEVTKLCDKESIERILLGLPLTMANRESASVQKVKKFKQQLEQQTNRPVELIDERLSTVQAESALHAQGIKSKQQREIKDNISAQLLLQQYLDHINKT